MSINETCYRELDVNYVLEMCNDWLERRNKRILEDREKLIENEINKKRFFSRTPKTREEIIENLQNDGNFISKWEEPYITCLRQAMIVEDMKNLCEVNKGKNTVLFSSEASFLFE